MADKEPYNSVKTDAVTDTDTDTENNTELRLVKNTEQSKRDSQKRLDPWSKMIYWCVGIIVIIFLFYFLMSMISDAEELESGNDKRD